MTLGTALDEIRRRLFISPAIDLGIPGAKPGDANPSQPHPSNNLIMQALREAASIVNRETGFTGTQTEIQYAVAAQTNNGPFKVPLDQIKGGMDGTISTIRRVFWATSTSGTATRKELKPTTYEELSRDQSDWINRQVAEPEKFIVEAYQLGILPGPNEAGYLFIHCGLSATVPHNLLESFIQLPVDYVPVLLDQAVVELCAMNPGDIEMQKRMEYYVPKAQKGMRDIEVWLSNIMEDYQSRVSYDSHRAFAGGRSR